MADAASLLLLSAVAVREAPEPLARGLASAAWIVALAMGVLIVVAVFYKLPGKFTGNLDTQIAKIRDQLAEARELRVEAEALRADYAARIAHAERDAVAMLDHARHEAEAIVAQAKMDMKAMIARREKIATDKIEAAERAAVSALRAKAAGAAVAAAGELISARHDAGADKPLVDQAIAAI